MHLRDDAVLVAWRSELKRFDPSQTGFCKNDCASVSYFRLHFLGGDCDVAQQIEYSSSSSSPPPNN